MRQEKRVKSTGVFLAVTYTDLGRHGRCRAQRTCHSSSTPSRYNNTSITRMRWDPHGGWRRVPASVNDLTAQLAWVHGSVHVTGNQPPQLRLKLLSGPSLRIYSEFFCGDEIPANFGCWVHILLPHFIYTPIFIVIVIGFLCILRERLLQCFNKTEDKRR